MTTTDKTGEQLVQSIRKTKATGTTRTRSTTTGGTETSTATSTAKTEPAPVKPAATKTSDPYQHGRRVWPD